MTAINVYRCHQDFNIWRTKRGGGIVDYLFICCFEDIFHFIRKLESSVSYLKSHKLNKIQI